jgi:hypothetical protein
MKTSPSSLMTRAYITDFTKLQFFAEQTSMKGIPLPYGYEGKTFDPQRIFMVKT